MNRLIRTLFAVLLVLTTASACAPSWQSSSSVSTSKGIQKSQALNASAGNAATLNGDETFIMIFREKGFVGSATAWPLRYNGKNAGALKNGSFIAIKTNAGPKSLTPESHTGIYSEGVVPLQFNAVAGNTYYFKHGTDSIYTAKLKLYPIAAAQGALAISGYGLANLLNDYVPTKQGETSQIKSVVGRAFVERGIKTFPATPGFPLRVGDKVNVEEGSQASILLAGSGVLKITEKTSFQVPAAATAKAPPGILDSVWNKMKVILQGESFGLKAPTAGPGVRR